IVDSPDKFRGWKKDARSKGIKPGHIAAFQRFQPYRGCNWSAALRDLSNGGKHREFPVLGGAGIVKIYDRCSAQVTLIRSSGLFSKKNGYVRPSDAERLPMPA